jgi:hypothetical protein
MNILTDPEKSPVNFAHPSEEEFARILDYYGLAWDYEPRTFVLERDEEGAILEAFSPDFYLPQQDLYIELTTLRPKLIRIKNHKVRRLRELYPEINIKLFKRRNIRDLMIKYGIDEQAENILDRGAQ